MKWLRRLLRLQRSGDVYVVVNMTGRSPQETIVSVHARREAALLVCDTNARYSLVNRDILDNDDDA